VTAAVVGVRSEAQLIENLKSVELQLTAEDLQALDACSKLRPEYPGWYHNMPLGRMPGATSRVG
jgi:diketogulonate reductase-like aldo/keto reductase